MDAKLDELTRLLKKHIGHYEKLAELLSLEQAALMDLDLERLQKVTKAKETMALKIKLLVPALAQAITEAAGLLGVPAEPLPTLAELSQAALEPYRTRFEKAGVALARLKRGVLRHNEDNQVFVREALDMVSGSVAILTGAAASAPRKG
ncbi:MAG: flagellar protein FlgN, partial [Thermodesulfobacteriota bacterium]